MAQPRRKCRLADSSHKGVDLRLFENEIIQTINNTVPGKNPVVFQNYFSTDPLSPGEAVAVGRALSKIDDLKYYGKTVTIFRLFDGKMYEDENSDKVTAANYIESTLDKLLDFFDDEDFMELFWKLIAYVETFDDGIGTFYRRLEEDLNEGIRNSRT